MKTRGISIILAVVMCIDGGGCQTASFTKSPVCEYRIGCPATQKVVAEPGVFALCRWRAGWPIQQFESSTEVTDLFVDRASPIGFRRDGNILLAVGGSTTWPLQDGHYSWSLVEPSGTHEYTPKKPPPTLSSEETWLILAVPVYLGWQALHLLLPNDAH